MLTPRFDLSQTDDDVTINIYAKYANIRDTEVYVGGDDFRFHSAPYYLRLKLPGEIAETDLSSGTYDCETGTFTLRLSKVHKGEHFENLDMITTLLAPSSKTPKVTGPTIEVIGNPAAQDDAESSESNDAENGDDWFVAQSPPPPEPTILSGAPKYGFANKVSGALGSFEPGWLRDVIDLPFPDTTPVAQRKVLREADERERFSDDHYMADLVHVEETAKPSIMFEPDFYKLSSETVEFTDKEKDMLKELRNKEFLLDNNEKQAALYGLADILFGYCYNHRANLGENSSESSWDINKISATLSWLQNYTSLEDVVRTAIRRSITFPIYRHWDLSIKVFEDVKQIVKIGKKMVVKCFCEILELFSHSFEPRYILSELYIKDYLIWLQQIPDSLLLSLYNALDSLTPKKEDMGLDLVELEAATWSVLEEETAKESTEDENLIIGNAIHDVVHQLDKITMSADSDDSESDSEPSSDTSSSLSSSSCSSTSDSSDSDTSTTSSDDTTSSVRRRRVPLIEEVKTGSTADLDSDDETSDSEH